MHIAIVREHFDREHGGAERYAVGLACGLRERGHDVSVVCHRAAASDAEGFGIYPVSGGKWAGRWRRAAFAWMAGRKAASLGADAVVALARCRPADIFRLGDPLNHFFNRLRASDSAPGGASPEFLRLGPLLRLEERLLLPGLIHHYVTNSELVKRQIIHGFGVSPERISVFRNPVDTRRFSPDAEIEGGETRRELGIAPDEMVVLFSGMDFVRKGLIPAARAFALMIRRAPELRAKLRFLVVGKGDALPARRLLEAEGCADRMIDAPASARIERYYGASNVLVLPTLYDPSANAVGEAIACGTPVVTTTLNGASEIIKPGDNGIVVASRENIEELANAVTRLLAEERVQRSRAYVALAKRPVGWDEHLALWEERLLETVERKLRSRLSLPVRCLPRTRADMDQRGACLLLNSIPTARRLLAALPLTPPDGCFDPPTGSIIKRHNNSIVARLRVPGGGASQDQLFAPSTPPYAYLKIREDDPAAGIHEFEACMRATAAGVNTMLPLAAGDDGRRGFFISAEAPGLPLDEFIRRYAKGPETRSRTLRRAFSTALAEMTAKFHGAGLNHRDYYASHIRAALDDKGEPLLTLIDLQRVQMRKRTPLRWLTKDLGELDFSFAPELVSRTERLRFLRHYVWHLGIAVPRRRLLKMIRRRRVFIARRHQRVMASKAASDARLAAAGGSPAPELVPATAADIDHRG